MKLAIVGSRHYNNYEEFKQYVLLAIKEWDKNVDLIISGGADGVDSLAERFASEHGIPTLIFKPEWSKYGRAAGPIRNLLIISSSTHVIAFPATTSTGTYDSIKQAQTQKKTLKIINI